MGNVIQFKSKQATRWEEQKMFWQWCKSHPLCKKYMFYIPREDESPNKRKLKAQIGLREGVFHYFLSYPSKNYHGLYIEIGALNKGCAFLTPHQKIWLNDMASLGYHGACCLGYLAACDVVENYLAM